MKLHQLLLCIHSIVWDIMLGKDTWQVIDYLSPINGGVRAYSMLRRPKTRSLTSPSSTFGTASFNNVVIGAVAFFVLGYVTVASAGTKKPAALASSNLNQYRWFLSKLRQHYSPI